MVPQKATTTSNFEKLQGCPFWGRVSFVIVSYLKKNISIFTLDVDLFMI